MKKWLKSHRRLIIILLVLEILVIFGHFTGLSILLFFPAYLITILTCCGDYPSPEILLVMVQLNALIYAIGISAFVKLFGKIGSNIVN